MSAGDPSMFAVQGFAPGTEIMSGNTITDQADALQMASAAEASSAAGMPFPTPSPNSADAALREPSAQLTEAAAGQQLVMANTGVDALNQGITQNQPAQASASLYSVSATSTQPVPAQSITVDPSQAALQAASVDLSPANTGAELVQPQVQVLAVVAPPKKQSIFARLFAQQPKSARNAPSGTKKRLVSPKTPQVAVASASSGSGAVLPGVRLSKVLGRSSGGGADNSDSSDIQLASAAGLARLAPNGLRLQTERVEVSCFKPQLVRALKSIESHYGRPLVVTSGYRNPKHNRRIGGASGSRHTSCEAADIQIEGVSKWQLAKYLRSMPGRGGVGTYCHTESVHIDIGNMRDWNWRCRRRK